MRILLALLFLGFTAPASANAPPSGNSLKVAEAEVGRTLREMVALVADCRLPLATDPLALRGVVDQHLRPKADVLYAGQVILGRHWADADPDQRRRFAEALYGTLVSRYSSGLLLLTDRNVQLVPGAIAPREGEAAVEILIVTGLAAPVPVTLQLRRGSERWRIYDARWEGQSFVLSLRQAFAEQIRRDGLETVIQRLERSAGDPPGPPEQRETAAGRCLQARTRL
jgi:phospholipid transport system substrate-binding protein